MSLHDYKFTLHSQFSLIPHWVLAEAEKVQLTSSAIVVVQKHRDTVEKCERGAVQ